jgi:metal-responsive CopG/Arc/MetJ family transcriptional regulator
VRMKTSVTLPGELLREIDKVDANRSQFLERAARKYLLELAREHRNRRDSEILNRHADRLNREAMDVLEYQDFG